MENGITSFEVFFRNATMPATSSPSPSARIRVKSQNDALLEIYRKLRPGDPPTLDTATQLFQGMFFDPRKYDFSRVGRMKFNIKLYDQIDATPLDKRTLDHKDFIDTIKYLLKLRKGIGASTISITSATAAFARSANCSRTSSASVSCAWSEPSRRRCRSTRKCRRPCRTTW